jgi:hypothetical protein
VTTEFDADDAADAYLAGSTEGERTRAREKAAFVAGVAEGIQAERELIAERERLVAELLADLKANPPTPLYV